MKEYFTLQQDKRREIVQNVKDMLGAQPEILFAYIHGSFLTALSFRDIDVAVYVDPAYLKERDVVDMELTMGAQLVFPYPIDLRILNMSPFYFQNGVVRTGELLFCRDEHALAAITEYSSQAMLDYVIIMNESYATLAS